MGLGNNTGVFTPTKVGTDNDWQDIATDGSISVGIRDGKLYSCGSNNGLITNRGQFGEGQLFPYPTLGAGSLSNINGTGSFTQIASGITDWERCKIGAGYSVYSVAKRTNGQLYWWGLVPTWTAGFVTEELQQSIVPTPTLINSSTGWSDFAAGSDFFAGINSGQLYSVGQNRVGQLGLGLLSDGATGLQQIGSENDWVKVDASDRYCVAIKQSTEDFPFTPLPPLPQIGYIYYYGDFDELWDNGWGGGIKYRDSSRLSIQLQSRGGPPLGCPQVLFVFPLDPPEDYLFGGTWATTGTYSMSGVGSIRVNHDYIPGECEPNTFTNVSGQDYIIFSLSTGTNVLGGDYYKQITPVPSGTVSYNVQAETGNFHIHVGYIHSRTGVVQEFKAPDNHFRIKSVELSL
jgi:hypothetical protein